MKVKQGGNLWGNYLFGALIVNILGIRMECSISNVTVAGNLRAYVLMLLIVKYRH